MVAYFLLLNSNLGLYAFIYYLISVFINYLISEFRNVKTPRGPTANSNSCKIDIRFSQIEYENIVSLLLKLTLRMHLTHMATVQFFS